MTNKLKSTELLALATRAVASRRASVAGMKGTNPQVVAMRDRCRAEMHMAEAFLAAMRGDATELRIYAQASD